MGVSLRRREAIQQRKDFQFIKYPPDLKFEKSDEYVTSKVEGYQTRVIYEIDSDEDDVEGGSNVIESELAQPFYTAAGIGQPEV